MYTAPGCNCVPGLGACNASASATASPVRYRDRTCAEFAPASRVAVIGVWRHLRPRVPSQRLTRCGAVHETNPDVFVVARPSLDLSGLRGYLDSVGGTSWLDLRLEESGNDPNPGELLVEFSGRACYRSWKPGLNPNVRRIRTNQREYFANLLRSGHGSVLEHANYSLAFRNVSRVFTHELVRHRAGSAFSQESLRFVRLSDIGFRVPPALERVQDQVIAIVERLEEFQVSAAGALGIDDDGVPFEVKKEVTSALRRLAPLGLSTDIIWTANVRTLRHVIEMRTAAGAEEELRSVFDTVARLMLTEAPGLFQDFQQLEDGSWAPEHHKV